MTQINRHPEQVSTPDVPRIRIIASAKSWIVGDAEARLTHAAKLPGVVFAVGMPDLHPGKGIPIGVAIISNGVVYPELAGNDIGCGMALWQTRDFAEQTQTGSLGQETQGA